MNVTCERDKPKLSNLRISSCIIFKISKCMNQKKVSDFSKLFNSINAKWLVSRSKYDDHTGQCKRTGGCYNELVVAFFSTGGGVKGKQIYTC